MLLHDLKQVVKLGVERVLLLIVEHPCGHECPLPETSPPCRPWFLRRLTVSQLIPVWMAMKLVPEFCLFGRDPEEVILFHVHNGPILLCRFNKCLVGNAADAECGIRNNLPAIPGSPPPRGEAP